MTVEIGVLIATIGMFLTIITFYLNRQHVAKNDGATLAEMRKDIEYIVKEIRSVGETLRERDEKHKDSIRRLHTRMDDHITKYHSQLSDGDKLREKL